MNFAPASISFTDDEKPQKQARQALMHHPTVSNESVREQLADVGASDWPVFSIAGHPGAWVTPKGNIPVSDFARVLTTLSASSDQWQLVADPRA